MYPDPSQFVRQSIEYTPTSNTEINVERLPDAKSLSSMALRCQAAGCRCALHPGPAARSAPAVTPAPSGRQRAGFRRRDWTSLSPSTGHQSPDQFAIGSVLPATAKNFERRVDPPNPRSS